MSHPTTVLALLVACAALPAAVASQTVAIPDVTIVDVREDITRPGMTVVISGDRIAAVGPSVCLGLTALAVAAPAAAQAGPSNAAEPTLLTPGHAVSDSIGPDTGRTYEIDLAPTQFVYAEVDQETVDVMVEAYRPDGTIVGVVDGSVRGPEAIRFDTEAAGRFRLVVRSARGEAGRYTVLLRRVEPTADTPAGRVDQLMAGYDPAAPGTVIAVTRNGELVFGRGYGLANIEYGVPLTPQSLFDLASVSKQFTGFAVALLIDRGELSLDDPVQRYLPELPEYEAPLLVRHLVYHTSGLRNFYALLRLQGVRLTDAITQDDALEMLRVQREINFEPGTEFLYSNAGYVLLATIVERVSGRPFPQFLQEEVFAPLGMTSAFVIDDYQRIVPRRVESYWRTSGDELRKVWAPMTAYGGRGVFSSAEDLARWLDNLERPRVGGERVVRLMHQLGGLDHGDPLGYGFGLDVAEDRGLRLIGHAGDGLGFRTYVGRVPEHGLGVAVLRNGPGSPDPFDVALRVIELFLDEQLHAEPAYSLDPEVLRRVAGDYVSDGGFPVRLVSAGDRLFGNVLGGPLVPMTPLSGITFTGMTSFGSSFRVTFDADFEGPVEQGTLSLYGTRPLRRAPAVDPAERWHPTPEELEEYAGVYHSPEIESTYVIAVDDAHLVARHRRNADEVLRPETRDVFSGVQGSIEVPRFIGTASFERDEHGAVTGMRVSAFRLRGLRFERMAGTWIEDRDW
jgi:CubicO group peptidase (beta-lactamase class C family)